MGQSVSVSSNQQPEGGGALICGNVDVKLQGGTLYPGGSIQEVEVARLSL